MARPQLLRNPTVLCLAAAVFLIANLASAEDALKPVGFEVPITVPGKLPTMSVRLEQLVSTVPIAPRTRMISIHLNIVDPDHRKSQLCSNREGWELYRAGTTSEKPGPFQPIDVSSGSLTFYTDGSVNEGHQFCMPATDITDNMVWTVVNRNKITANHMVFRGKFTLYYK